MPPDCQAGQCRLHADEPLAARYADVHNGEDQVERSPALMGYHPPYKKRGTSLPGGGSQGGKGMTSNERSFTPKIKMNHMIKKLNRIDL